MIKIIRIAILVLLGLATLLPFLLPPSLYSVTKSNGSLLASHEETKSNQPVKNQLRLHEKQLQQPNQGHQPQQQIKKQHVSPRRYFATTNSNETASYYLEPHDSNGKASAYSKIPSRAWDEATLQPLDYSSPATETLIKQTMEQRLNVLLESDALPAGKTPTYLPPQFPQWDRSLHKRIAHDSTILGMPPKCCPNIDVHKHLTKNFSDANILTEEELNDCECRSPRNYARDNRPIATLVTAFYQMSSKHPIKMYEKTSGQLLATSDPMIIFCEPNSTWIDFFIERRQHAPTIIVPLPSKELRLVKHFPQKTFWKKQYEIDPEAPTHHKNVNTMLYVIWDEKLVLLHTVAMLNPFNTTQFVWVDTGYWRNPAPHMYRNSAVRINITESGVKDESTLLFQMIRYSFDRDVVISGNQVLVGGNCFAGTFNGVSNLYSAFYETFWAMASTGQFVGSDQKVFYRACHHYPDACHIHAPRKMKQWLNMLGELLPGLGTEKIGVPLKLKEWVAPLDELPVPPMGIVDDATSKDVWN